MSRNFLNFEAKKGKTLFYSGQGKYGGDFSEHQKRNTIFCGLGCHD